VVYQTSLPTESTPLCLDPSTSLFKTISFTKLLGYASASFV
jgi:hypothetical protein